MQMDILVLLAISRARAWHLYLFKCSFGSRGRSTFLYSRSFLYMLQQARASLTRPWTNIKDCANNQLNVRLQIWVDSVEDWRVFNPHPSTLGSIKTLTTVSLLRLSHCRYWQTLAATSCVMSSDGPVLHHDYGKVMIALLPSWDWCCRPKSIPDHDRSSCILLPHDDTWLGQVMPGSQPVHGSGISGTTHSLRKLAESYRFIWMTLMAIQCPLPLGRTTSRLPSTGSFSSQTKQTILTWLRMWYLPRRLLTICLEVIIPW